MQEAAILQTKQRSVLTNFNFLLLFIGGVVSRLGNGVHYTGLVWYILEAKGSGFAVGSVLMVASLPGVILGPFSGVLADRFDRKQIIIWMDVFRGLIALAMGFMILSGTMNFAFLIVGTVLLSICGTLFNPAVSASIPNIVKDEHLTQANSLEHLSMNLTGVIGPGLGGILIAIWGVAGVFLINGVSFLLSALSEVFIKFPPQEQRSEGKKVEFYKDIKEGARFIHGNKPLFYTLFVCLFANFLYAGALTVAFPMIVRNTLGASAQEFGIFGTGWPIGAALGGLILTMLPEIKKAYKIFVGAIGAQTFFTTIIGIVTLPVVAGSLGLTTVKFTIIACLIISGVFNAFINIPLMVIFQRMVPNDMRGRIFGLIGTLSQGLVPVSIGLTGLIVDLIEPGYVFIAVGVGIIILMADFMRKKEVREM